MIPSFSNGTTSSERPRSITIASLLADSMPTTPAVSHQNPLDQFRFTFQHPRHFSPDEIVLSGPTDGYPSPTASHDRAESGDRKPFLSDSPMQAFEAVPRASRKTFVVPHMASKCLKKSRANNGGGIQKQKKKKKEDPTGHSLTQGRLRVAQSLKLKVLERLLMSIGWEGRRVNSNINAKNSGLVHTKFDIQECGNRQVSFLIYLARILFRPERIAQLSRLDLWEPDSCSEDNYISRESVSQPLGLQYSSPQDERRRRDILLDMMALEFRPLVERHFAEHVHLCI